MPEADAEFLRSIGRSVALRLLQSGAVRVNLQEPFKLASGNFSPLYVNCRLVLADVTVMQLFAAAAGFIIRRRRLDPDLLAGGETAGIPLAAYLSAALCLPMVYVRKAAKNHGLKGLIEGGDVQGKKVILVEDLITDAGSKIHFIESLKAAGAGVTDVLVLFDRCQGGGARLAEMGVCLHSVTDLEQTLDLARSAGLIPEPDGEGVREYLDDPEGWHRRRRLPFQRA